MEITVSIEKEFKGVLTPGWIKKVMKEILTAENASLNSELSLVITGFEKITELHKQYLDEEGPTDVISFALTELSDDKQPFVNPPDDSTHLGEIVICYPQAVKQAGEHGHEPKKEVALLMVHGALHLLGYDHATPDEEKTMRNRESAIMNIISERNL